MNFSLESKDICRHTFNNFVMLVAICSNGFLCFLKAGVAMATTSVVWSIVCVPLSTI